MLEQMRRGISGWTAKLLLGLLVLSFAVWGVADGGFNYGSSNTVLSAGDTRVSVQDYQIAYQQGLSRVAQQLGRQPSAEEAAMFGVDQSVLAQLSAGAVLDEQGRRIGLGLSEEGLLRLISENPAFQDTSGNFSRAAFRNVLSNVGLSEAGYISDLGDTAVRTQIVQAVSDGVGAPEAFSNALGLYNGERRTVGYVTVPPAATETIAEPSDEALNAFFEENADSYAAPEYRAVSYAALTPEAMADPSSVTDEEIAAEYERSRARFATAERRRVRQIVFPDAEAAEAAAARLGEGATFEEVAAEAGRSAADTDLGLLAQAEIPDAAIAEAAFALEAGATSGVVAGTFGPVILGVTEIQPETVRPLDEVREEIRGDLAVDRAADAVSIAYDAFEDARASGSTVEEAAERAGLAVETIAAIDREGNDPAGEPVADLPAANELLRAAFEAQPNADNAPLNYDSGSFLFYDVTSIEPARERELDEVRERVVEDWKAAEAQRLLGERMAALEARVEGSEALADIAAAEGLTVATAAAVTRATGRADLGTAGAAAAFSGPSGLVAVAPAGDGSGQVLLQVTEVAPPADPLSNVTPEQSEGVAEALRNDLLQSYVTLLQQQFPVTYNPQAVETAQGALR